MGHWQFIGSLEGVLGAEPRSLPSALAWSIKQGGGAAEGYFWVPLVPQGLSCLGSTGRHRQRQARSLSSSGCLLGFEAPEPRGAGAQDAARQTRSSSASGGNAAGSPSLYWDPTSAPPRPRPSSAPPRPQSRPRAGLGRAWTPAAPRAGRGSWRQQLCGPFWPSPSAFEGSHGSAHALVTTTVPRRGSLRAGQNQGREGADLFVRSASWGAGHLKLSSVKRGRSP